MARKHSIQKQVDELIPLGGTLRLHGPDWRLMAVAVEEAILERWWGKGEMDSVDRNESDPDTGLSGVEEYWGWREGEDGEAWRITVYYYEGGE